MLNRSASGTDAGRKAFSLFPSLSPPLSVDCDRKPIDRLIGYEVSDHFSLDLFRTASSHIVLTCFRSRLMIEPCAASGLGDVVYTLLLLYAL